MRSPACAASTAAWMVGWSPGTWITCANWAGGALSVLRSGEPGGQSALAEGLAAGLCARAVGIGPASASSGRARRTASRPGKAREARIASAGRRRPGERGLGMTVPSMRDEAGTLRAHYRDGLRGYETVTVTSIPG